MDHRCLKKSNPNLPVFLLCEINQSTHKIILCENKTKPLLHVKHDCSMQSVKQHDNLQKFPNATSITSVEGLVKTLAVSVITFILTPEWDQ